MINGTISVAVGLKSGTENRGTSIYIYIYGISKLISTRAMASVTDDCQNSTISHAVIPNPFKSPYSYPARSTGSSPPRPVSHHFSIASYRFASVSLHRFKSQAAHRAQVNKIIHISASCDFHSQQLNQRVSAPEHEIKRGSINEHAQFVMFHRNYLEKCVSALATPSSPVIDFAISSGC